MLKSSGKDADIYKNNLVINSAKGINKISSQQTTVKEIKKIASQQSAKEIKKITSHQTLKPVS